MRPDLPWSVAGISTEAREAARAAARREGLSVGEWLTRRIVSELSDMNQPRSQWSYRSDVRPQPEPLRIPSDEMLEHVSRSEAETAEVYRRIEDQLRALSRRLDASERSQTESSRVVSKAAVEMNIAAREQAQAFDQIGNHVANLAERLDKVEERDADEGIRDAVKALHQGLTRLADQITETANQSATQISNLADNLETVAGRVSQARQDATAATQALEGRLGAIDERLRTVETTSQAHAGSIDRALEAIEEQKNVPSPMEAINRLEGRLEDSVRRLEDRGPDPSLDRRLGGIERTMADVVDRIETRDDSAQSLEANLRKLMARLEGLETVQRETADEVRRAAAAAAKPVEPPPPPEPAPVPPPVVAPAINTAAAEFGPLAGFEPPPFATEVPPFVSATPAPPPSAAEVPPFVAPTSDPAANAFGLPPDPTAANLTAEMPLTAETPAESYLDAARRSARAAAAQEAERSSTLGALRWGNAAKPEAEAVTDKPKKKSNPVVVALLVVILIVVTAALLLHQRAINAPAPAPAAAALNTKAKPAIKTADAAPDDADSQASQAAPAASAAPQPAHPAQAPAQTAAQALPPPAQQHPAAAPQPVAPQPGAQPNGARQAVAAAPLDRITQAANAGNARAQLIVGLKYLDTSPANETEAAKWLTKAADAGEPVAQYRLGGLYERGRGVTADPVKAVRLYQAAANQGSRKAMHNLAVAYAEGTGVKKDYAEASRWFLKAANLGLSDSQFNLAVLYERGYGVPQNLIDAYKWYAIAAAQGDGEAKTRMNAISGQLDADARAAAQHAADGFHAAPLNARANVAPTVVDATRG